MKQLLISTTEQDWSKAFEKLVNGENGYNNQYHRSVEMTPNEALEAVKNNSTAKLKAITVLCQSEPFRTTSGSGALQSGKTLRRAT